MISSGLTVFSQTELEDDSDMRNSSSDSKKGIHVSTSFQLNSHRSKTVPVWSSESGYGFSIGGTYRKDNQVNQTTEEELTLGQKRAFISGFDYEYVAFDSWVGGNLVSSIRFHSLHIPLQWNFNFMGHFYFSAGTGANVVFRSRAFVPGSNVSLYNVTRPFQPYVVAGIGSFKERNTGFFDLGIQTRFHFMDIWRKTYPTYAATTSWLVSFDLVMRFYL